MRRDAGVTLIEMLIAVTLLSLLSVAMLFALRVGLQAHAKTNAKLMDNRRVAGAQRVLEEELEGMTPVVVPCGGNSQSAPNVAFFEGEPQSMRLVSIFSLQQAWRGQPKILELFVIPGEQGGVRLVVNELPYTGPVSAGRLCTGAAPDSTGHAMAHFTAAGAGPDSFVLADKLAYCRFNYLWRSTTPNRPAPTWRSNGGGGWPIAVRVEMAPLEPDPSRLQPITVTAAIHLHLSPEIPYGDY